MPQRRAQLLTWLQQDCHLSDFDFTPASGDASFRRYFRLSFSDGSSLIAMDAPPEKEDCHPFIEVTRRLQRTGVHVPEIVEQDLQQGFLLLEDLGERLYLDELNTQTADDLYGDASAALLQIQLKGEVAGLPEYNEALLYTEMALFEDWLVTKHLGLVLSDDEHAMLERVKSVLVESALAQPQVLVHRDYHSRNLLRCEVGNPGIIDFQDAVYGPITYDLVSLLRDCYVRWPLQQVDQWVTDYAEKAIAVGLMSEDEMPQFLEWFDLMGVQRHLKAAGIFARLNQRDGKPGYMQDIPRTLGYIVEAAQRRPVLKDLADFIALRVLPVL